MIGHVDHTSEIVLVSNRLPVHRVKRGRLSSWEISPGGLVSALRPIIRELSCTWVGWMGESGEAPPPFDHDGIRNWPVPLSPLEVRDFYEGFCNRILWPLYHDALRPPEYRHNWWPPYVTVNRRFAEAAAEAIEPGGTVWIHDYHLQLVPAMLRELKPDVRIGFFLHIPFPPQELFAQLPWRREILEGLLGADVVGFQTKVGAENFRMVAQRFASASRSDDCVEFNGRQVYVGAFPISVDVEQFERLAESPEVIAKADEFHVRLGPSRKIMLGLDRLDYTKGIDIRLEAFRELLRSRQVSRDEVVLVQIAIPSREHVAEYRELRIKVERLVGEINGEFGDIGRTPIQYLHRSVDQVELAALYRAADVMLVTPLRDGMNLVAKEYCATRLEDNGVLILSEFTGAAKELTSALLANPHDIAEVTGCMERALRMPAAEQATRMRDLRRTIKAHTVRHWADEFFRSLAYARA